MKKMSMPFGKFKGVSVDEIPESYLEWVWTSIELREPLRTHIEAVLFGGGAVGPVEPGDLSTVYRQMAMKYHPDRGGSHKQMLVVNEFYQALKERAHERCLG